MEEIIYKEYKLGTILNVVTGVNILSTWPEILDIITFFYGTSFESYQVPKILNDIRNKIITNNSEFVDIDVVELKLRLLNASDKQMVANEWLSEQEAHYPSTILISRSGKIKNIGINEAGKLESDDKPKQFIK